MRLIPREQKFFQMFADVASNLTKGATLLYDILKNPSGDPARIGQLQEIEHRGDEMTHTIIRMLNQTFITPFDREDIHLLTSSLDDVLDFVNAAATRMTLYRITNPPPAAAEIAGFIVTQAGELSKAVALLDDNQRLLEHCDAVLRVGGASQGADMMVSVARERGLAVYHDLDEVPGCSDGYSRPGS